MSQQHVRYALSHRTQDIPLWLHWYSDEFASLHADRVASLQTTYPDDLAFFSLEHPKVTWENDTTAVDRWSVTYLRSPYGVGTNPVASILSQTDVLTQRDVIEYAKTWPTPFTAEHLAERRRAWRHLANQTGTSRFWLGRLGNGPFERGLKLRGMESILMDFYVSPKGLGALLSLIEEHLCQQIDLFGQMSLEGVFMTDDVGDQRSLLLSPSLWRQWIRPIYKRLIDRVHAHGMAFILHTCGNVADLIDDYVELGVDALHPIQAGCLDLGAVIAQTRGQLAVFVGLDVQSLLPTGTPQLVKAYVTGLVRQLRSTGAGYLIGFGNTITPDVPYENVEVAVHTLHRERRLEQRGG